MILFSGIKNQKSSPKDAEMRRNPGIRHQKTKKFKKDAGQGKNPENKHAKLAGLTAEEDLKETTKESMKKRLPWLIITRYFSISISGIIH